MILNGICGFALPGFILVFWDSSQLFSMTLSVWEHAKLRILLPKMIVNRIRTSGVQLVWHAITPQPWTQKKKSGKKLKLK